MLHRFTYGMSCGVVIRRDGVNHLSPVMFYQCYRNALFSIPLIGAIRVVMIKNRNPDGFGRSRSFLIAHLPIPGVIQGWGFYRYTGR